MKIHKIALILPAMSDAEYADLRDSIRDHGLLEPVTIYEGEILDGRNRARACDELGITPPTVPYSGTDPIGFVIDKNIHRRHLDTSQRAMIAARLATLKQGRPDKPANLPVLPTQPKAAEMLNVSERVVRDARKVVDGGVKSLVAAVERGKIAVSEAAQIATLDPKDQFEILAAEKKSDRQAATKIAQQVQKQNQTQTKQDLVLTGKQMTTTELYYRIAGWNKLSTADKLKIVTVGFESKKQMNPQETASIDWAKWSLNTVTGCLHGCPYCYARDIAERYFEYKFEPAFHPARLSAPGNTKVPINSNVDPSYKNIFVNSMSDLFGKWVPDDWIEATIEMARRNPQWNFLALTKFPIRAADFEFPDNWWMGTTVDVQSRIDGAEKAFAKIRCRTKWLSCEPLLEPLEFNDLSLFQWIVIGGASRSNNTPEWIPPFDWLVALHLQARSAGLPVYHKVNCGLGEEIRVKEFPWAKPKQKALPKELKNNEFRRER